MDIVVNGLRNDFPSCSTPISGQNDYHSNILASLGYKAENLPLAEFLAGYYDLPGHWLIASPIHWKATHNDAMIVAAGESLDLSLEESHLWFNEIADFLQSDNFSPFFHSSQLWLFRIDNKPKITSRSLSTLLHQSLMPVLNSLDPSLYWQRLITELQMYLNAHPLNQQREGRLPVNGLWFWGEGELSLINKEIFFTDDQVLLNLWPNKTKTLTPATVIKKNNLLIINEVKQIEFCNLTNKIRHGKSHWYWNNLAYSTPATPWWSRLWRY